MSPYAERYAAHLAALEDAPTPAMRAWHLAAARGLYRMMVDEEMEGGPACPAGMPHALCITDSEVQDLARRNA